jgi:hypothetical protein
VGLTVETEENTIFGYIMQKAEHCFDFHTAFVPGAISRGYFQTERGIVSKGENPKSK